MTQHEPGVSPGHIRDHACEAVQLNGQVWGYDPGGNNHHGVARFTITDGHISACASDTVGTVGDAVEWLGSTMPLAFGADTLTAWSTGRNGDRPADRSLRLAYPDATGSVLSPNTIRGAMCVNGMAVVCLLRSKYPKLLVSEAHPKVLYFSLTRNLYGSATLAERTAILAQWLGICVAELNIGDDNAWDATSSAYAAWEGLRGNWTEDLHQKPLRDDECLVHPAGPTVYFWPEHLNATL